MAQVFNLARGMHEGNGGGLPQEELDEWLLNDKRIGLSLFLSLSLTHIRIHTNE